MTRRKLYPWDDWFSRKRKFKLIKGKDFAVAPYVMAQQIRTEARNWEGNPRVSIQIIKNTLVVEILWGKKK